MILTWISISNLINLEVFSEKIYESWIDTPLTNTVCMRQLRSRMLMITCIAGEKREHTSAFGSSLYPPE